MRWKQGAWQLTQAAANDAELTTLKQCTIGT
jgi:hypothetical protein